MGNIMYTCNGCKSVSTIDTFKLQQQSSDAPVEKKNTKMKVTLVLLGLDDSGKTTVAMHVLQKQVNSTVPTLGFSTYAAPSFSSTQKNVSVTLLDVGGSSDMRSLWPNYFGIAHGIIFLLDSSQPNRLEELKEAFHGVLQHPQVQEKPILLLLNKQDLDNVMEEMDICRAIDLEQIVNQNRCPTRIENCSAISPSFKEPESKSKYKMDSGIERGYNWIVQFVTNHWFRINSRVQTAIEEEAEVQRLRLQTLRNKYGGLDKADETKEKTKMNGKSNKDPFRPIKEVVQEIDRRKESESNEMTNQMNGNLPENNPNTVEDATFDVKPNLIEENATHLAIGGGKISEQKTEI